MLPNLGTLLGKKDWCVNTFAAKNILKLKFPQVAFEYLFDREWKEENLNNSIRLCFTNFFYFFNKGLP